MNVSLIDKKCNSSQSEITITVTVSLNAVYAKKVIFGVLQDVSLKMVNMF